MYVMTTKPVQSKFIPKVRSAQRSGTEALTTKTGNDKYYKWSKYKREHMVNRVSSYFPKGDHSATEIELMGSDCKQPLRIERIRALNGCAGKVFGAATRQHHNNSDKLSVSDMHISGCFFLSSTQCKTLKEQYDGLVLESIAHPSQSTHQMQ